MSTPRPLASRPTAARPTGLSSTKAPVPMSRLLIALTICLCLLSLGTPARAQWVPCRPRRHRITIPSPTAPSSPSPTPPSPAPPAAPRPCPSTRPTGTTSSAPAPAAWDYPSGTMTYDIYDDLDAGIGVGRVGRQRTRSAAATAPGPGPAVAARRPRTTPGRLLRLAGCVPAPAPLRRLPAEHHGRRKRGQQLLRLRVPRPLGERLGHGQTTCSGRSASVAYPADASGTYQSAGAGGYHLVRAPVTRVGAATWRR